MYLSRKVSMAFDTFSESSVTPKVEKPLPHIAEMTYFKHSLYGGLLQEALAVCSSSITHSPSQHSWAAKEDTKVIQWV